ncbi:MAG: hypothetical protein M0Z99_19125 [Betaproteobacteria bacterium]|nr:hypothetical protein [Betaproteobacteria bacterium]
MFAVSFSHSAGEQSIDDSTKHVDNFVRDVIRKHFELITEALIHSVDYKFSDVQWDR